MKTNLKSSKASKSSSASPLSPSCTQDIINIAPKPLSNASLPAPIFLAADLNNSQNQTRKSSSKLHGFNSNPFENNSILFSSDMHQSKTVLSSSHGVQLANEHSRPTSTRKVKPSGSQIISEPASNLSDAPEVLPSTVQPLSSTPHAAVSSRLLKHSTADSLLQLPAPTAIPSSSLETAPVIAITVDHEVASPATVIGVPDASSADAVIPEFLAPPVDHELIQDEVPQPNHHAFPAPIIPLQ